MDIKRNISVALRLDYIVVFGSSRIFHLPVASAAVRPLLLTYLRIPAIGKTRTRLQFDSYSIACCSSGHAIR